MIKHEIFEDWLNMDQKFDLKKSLPESRVRVMKQLNEFYDSEIPKPEIISIQETRIRGIDLESDWGHRLTVFYHQ